MQNKHYLSVLDQLPYIQLIDKTRLSVVDSFGYHYLTYDGAVFASVYEEKLYLKGDDKYNDLFQSLSMQPLVIKHQFTDKVLNYFQVPLRLLQDIQLFMSLLTLVINTALEHRTNHLQKKKNRLKDLPNINLSLERLLWKIGIKDVITLTEIGAFDAFYQLKTHFPSLSINILFKLHCALKHSHSQCLSEGEKDELIQHYQAYQASKQKNRGQ